MRARFRTIFTAALCLFASSAVAQFQQYTPPGTTGPVQLPSKESLEQSMADARWRLGPVRLDPWFAIKDVSFLDRILLDLDEQEVTVSDFSFTVGAGAQAYMPIGGKLVWSAWALPEYVWSEDEARRRLNGRYGTGLYAELSRLSFGLSAGRSDSLSIVTPEFPQRINNRQDLAQAALEIELRAAVHLYADATTARYRNLLDEEPGPGVPPYNNLDRDEDVLRAGLRFRPSQRLQIGVGIEDSQADFAPSSVDRSNSGSGPALELRYSDPRIRLDLDLVYRSLEPATEDSVFVPYEETTGNLLLDLNPESRLGGEIYTRRNLGYSVTQAYSSFDSQRLGLAVRLRPRPTLQLRIFGEQGSDDFVAVSDAPGRSDDVRSYGAEFSVEPRRRVALRLTGYRTKFESNLPAFDREISEVILSMTLGRTSIVAR